MRKHSHTLSIALALGLAAALQTTTVVAGKQIYPGSMCVQWSENAPTPVLSSSRIYNASSGSEMTVDCPILHQNFDSSSGNNLDDADIGIIDASASRDANCWAASRFQIGSVVYGSSGGTRTTVGWGNHEQDLDFAGTARHPENWYYIGCSIPRTDAGRRSGITYYSGQD
jgi:hypothetical protein